MSNALVAKMSICVAAVAATWISHGCIIPGRGQVVDTHAVMDQGATAPSGSDDAGGPFEFSPELNDDTEARFCRTMRPVTSELRGLVDRHVRCISSNYVEDGYFGTTSDLASHSLLNACFSADTRTRETLRFHERPLGRIATTISERVRIGVDGQIDMSRFGLQPSKYVLEGTYGVSSASILVSFVDPVVRTPANLGQALATVEINQEATEGVRQAAAQCRKHLCKPSSVHTVDLVSAKVVVNVTLEGGEAHGLRATTINQPVLVTGTGRSFTIQPLERINLAARFGLSQPALASDDACRNEPELVPAVRSGSHSVCSTLGEGGLRVTFEGCGGEGTLQCRFTVMSPARDRSITIMGAEHSSLFDDRGSGHGPDSIGVGDRWDRPNSSLNVAADTATYVVMQFRDVPTGLSRSPRVTLVIQEERLLEFSFRHVEIDPEPPPSNPSRCGDTP